MRGFLKSRVLRYGPLIAWIGVVFLLSSSAGSMSRTSIFVRPLLVWLFPEASEDLLLVYHGYVRKLAHFVLYAVLAFWGSRAFWGSGRSWLRDYWPAAAFAVVLATACGDEFQQSLNPARSGSVFDVVIDCAGGLSMIGCLGVYRAFRLRKADS